MAKSKKKQTSTSNVEEALGFLEERGSTASNRPEIGVIPTGIKDLDDVVLGCGGIPRGRIVELYAPESAGKSTLAYWLAGLVQKAGGVAVLWDLEGTYSPDYGKSCGIDNDALIMPDFDTGNDVLYDIKRLLASNTVDLIIVDSVPSIQPASIADVKDASDPSMKERLARATMLTQFCNDITGGYRVKRPGARNFMKVDGVEYHKLRHKKTCIIFINHAKSKIGVMFGDPTDTPGGKALKFASSIRIGMEHKKKSKDKDDYGRPEYRLTKIKAAKNKVAPPFGEMIIKLKREGGVTSLDEEPSTEELDDDVEFGE